MLMAPENGQILYGDDASPTEILFGMIATYSCDVQHILLGGTVNRTCGGNGLSIIGSWSGSAPRCECRFS